MILIESLYGSKKIKKIKNNEIEIEYWINY